MIKPNQTGATALNTLLMKTLSRARVRVSHPPACTSLALYLIDPQSFAGPLSHDEAQAVVAEPAYWSFCWASGQVLAQYLLQHPETVQNKCVVDIGAGSGIVAIAAAKAGAHKVFACDIDSDALCAAKHNAALNQVEIECVRNLEEVKQPIDLICAADLMYDRDNYPMLQQFRERAIEVLLADSRLKQIPDPHYTRFACFEARTCPDLNEFEEFNQVRLYRAV